jgi:hypothetical protein
MMETGPVSETLYFKELKTIGKAPNNSHAHYYTLLSEVFRCIGRFYKLIMLFPCNKEFCLLGYNAV